MKPTDNESHKWIDGELRLAGMLDRRMIELLRAIEQSGSINQAAKQLELSYKGAWQMIERANNGAPQILVKTAIGGSKGGGTCLTEAGRSLLALFDRLERQHRQFLEQINRDLATNADAVLLLQRLVVRTTVRNQLFGSISEIQKGAAHAEVLLKLNGGDKVAVTIAMASLDELGIRVGADAVLLINSADILLTTDSEPERFCASNRFQCRILRLHQDTADSEAIVLLPGGEILSAMITRQSIKALGLAPGITVWAMFKANAPILGIRSPSR